jgi:thymidylate synthase
MHTHTFSILKNTLYLTSYQRSDDIPLGHAFNQVQVGWLLMVMAKITGLQAGIAYHKIVNAHIYEDQERQLVTQQMRRVPFPSPTLLINPDIKTLEDLETWVTVDDFRLVNYFHHPAIKFAFSV